MDDTQLATAIEAMIEELEQSHPAYEVQVLVEPGESAGILQLEVQVIHRETQTVARIRDAGDDPGAVLSRVTKAVHDGLPGAANAAEAPPPVIES
ncbi:MAG: hypothetical protein WKF63_10885 [Thermomicrobiales bacterium]